MLSWGTAWKYVSTGLDVVNAGVQIYSGIKQVEAAEDLQEAQEAEYRRQQQLAEAQARREARVSTAKLYAAQGQAGATLSTTASGVIGIGSTLGSGIEDLSERTGYNIETSKIQESASKVAGYETAISGLPTFAAEAGNFSSFLNTKEETITPGRDFNINPTIERTA